MNRLTRQIIIEAQKHVGVKEVGNNDGPEVRRWLQRVNRHPGDPWCCAFAWCMLDDACRALKFTNPVEPVAGVHLLLHVAREQRAWAAEPGQGYIFGIDHGVGSHGWRIGHCGIVVEVEKMHVLTIEGNTDEAGSREGQGVALKTRKIVECTLGFLDPGMLLVGQMCSTDHPEEG